MNNIKEYLSYNPETGLFTWLLNQCNNKIKAGDIAGCATKRGYIFITATKKQYLAHRLAWYFYYLKWPERGLDHINGIKNDNRIANLRLATHSENKQNVSYAQKNNKCNVRGIHFYQGRWRADINIKGINTYLGRFNTPEEAHQAYLTAKRLHHPFWVES